MAATALRRRIALVRPGTERARISIKGSKPSANALRTALPLRAASLLSAGKAAATTRIVAMTRRQIMLQQRRVRMVGRVRHHARPVRRRARHGAPACFGDKIVLRGEVAVKAAMREFGGFHDVGDADAGEALGAEQRGRRIDDALPVRRRLFPAYPHACIRALRSQHLTLDNLYDDRHQSARMMMSII